MVRKPKSKPAINTAFSPGTTVEISSDDKGFRGSWYIGTVISLPSPKDPSRLLVEYSSLFADEDGITPLREVVDVHQLRPVAPREKEREFKFSEEVDAFHNDGWWEGVITEESGDGKFAVFFIRSKEEIEFGSNELRLHREWENGVWIPPLEEEIANPSFLLQRDESANLPLTEEIKLVEPVKEHDVYGSGTQVEISSDEKGFEGAWFVATVIKPLGEDKFLIEYKALKTDDDKEFLREEVDILHIRPCPLSTATMVCFKLLDEVDAFYNDGWWVGVIAKVQQNSNYIVYFKTTNEEMQFQQSDLRLHQDWIDQKWVMASRGLEFCKISAEQLLIEFTGRPCIVALAPQLLSKLDLPSVMLDIKGTFHQVHAVIAVQDINSLDLVIGMQKLSNLLKTELV